MRLYFKLESTLIYETLNNKKKKKKVKAAKPQHKAVLFSRAFTQKIYICTLFMFIVHDSDSDISTLLNFPQNVISMFAPYCDQNMTRKKSGYCLLAVILISSLNKKKNKKKLGNLALF